MHRSLEVIIMDFLISDDILSFIKTRDLTIDELASALGVTRLSVSNWISGKTKISQKHINVFYSYIYKNGYRLNKIKEQFYSEEINAKNEVLLFHGAKTEIVGQPELGHNKKINDFGDGFYCGESLEQSAMFVATYPKSTLYMLKFKPAALKYKKYNVDREWMLTIAYYRGYLDKYKNSNFVQQIKNDKKDIDYIIAPIADNRMFEIVNQFVDGEITDVQCEHCLSATNLGMQYVFVSKKAFKNVTLLEKCYLANDEKETYLTARTKDFEMNQDKVQLAKIKYKNKGKYIGEIMK